MEDKTVTFKGKSYTLDDYGFLDPPEQWDEDFAEGMAETLDIFGGLTQKHWDFIRYLRGKFIEEKTVPVVVLACGVIMLMRTLMSGEEGASRVSEHIRQRPKLRWAIGLGLGGVVGALIGATSVGGGVLVVPSLILLFGLSPRQTVGTSILIAFVLTLASSLVYGASGGIDWPSAVIMSVGSLIGVPLGVKLSMRLSSVLLGRIVIVVILASGLMMFKGTP